MNQYGYSESKLKKDALRQEMDIRRKLFCEGAPEEKSRASVKIAEKVMALDEYRNAETIFCYVAMEDEPETRGIIGDALKRGKTVGVPLCISKDEMVAKRIESLEELEAKSFGIYEPSEDAPTLDIEGIDLAIIPCVTCNTKGERLGHGRGYYDRFLSSAGGEGRMVKCMINFSKLLSEEIPTDENDIVMDLVITD